MSRLGGMVRRVSRAAVLAGVVLLLAGCGTTMLTVPPGPGDYRDGFRDGCDSGYAASGNFLYVRAHDAEINLPGTLYRDPVPVAKSRITEFGIGPPENIFLLRPSQVLD